MTIEEVKEYYKDAKIVESHEGFEFELVEIDHIKSGGLGCNRGCYYYHGRTIYTPFDGFIKIIEHKTKPINISDLIDKEFSDFIESFNIKEKVVSATDDVMSSMTIVSVPKGMELDRNSIKFKKIEKQLPNTWEEFESQWSGLGKPLYGFVSSPIEYRNFRKLELLRDCYNDGWKADWSKDYGKYVIFRHKKGLETTETPFCVAFLNFKTAELRDKFLKNFKDIIEIAKPLL